MDASDHRQFGAAAAVVRNVLGPRVLGLYRYGSAVQGGLRPASDLDLFVVVDGPLSDEDRLALIDGLGVVSVPPEGPGLGRPLEVTVVRLDAVVPWPDQPVREFQFGEWLRSDFDRGDRSPAIVDHDLAPLVATVLTASVAVVGPPAAGLLVSPPPERLAAAMADGAPPLLDELDTDTTNVLLTLARMLYTGATGRVVPKDLAATWVEDELQPPAVDQLANARTRYRDGPAEAAPFEPDRVAMLAADLVSRIVDRSDPI